MPGQQTNVDCPRGTVVVERPSWIYPESVANVVLVFRFLARVRSELNPEAESIVHITVAQTQM